MTRSPIFLNLVLDEHNLFTCKAMRDLVHESLTFSDQFTTNRCANAGVKPAHGS